MIAKTEAIVKQTEFIIRPNRGELSSLYPFVLCHADGRVVQGAYAVTVHEEVDEVVEVTVKLRNVKFDMEPK